MSNIPFKPLLAATPFKSLKALITKMFITLVRLTINFNGMVLKLNEYIMPLFRVGICISLSAETIGQNPHLGNDFSFVYKF